MRSSKKLISLRGDFNPFSQGSIPRALLAMEILLSPRRLRESPKIPIPESQFIDVFFRKETLRARLYKFRLLACRPEKFMGLENAAISEKSEVFKSQSTISTPSEAIGGMLFGGLRPCFCSAGFAI